MMLQKLPEQVLRLMQKAKKICIQKNETEDRIKIRMEFSALLLKTKQEPVYYLEAKEPEVEIELNSEYEVWTCDVWWSFGKWFNQSGDEIQEPDFLKNAFVILYSFNPDGTGLLIANAETPIEWEVK